MDRSRKKDAEHSDQYKQCAGIFKEGVHDSSPQLYRMNCNKSYEVEM